MDHSAFDMPWPGRSDAPAFLGNMFDLDDFLDLFSIVSERARLDGADSIRWLLRYVDWRTREAWRTLPEAEGASFDQFVAAMKKTFYPGLSYLPRHTRSELVKLVRARAVKTITNEDEIYQYHGSFVGISAYLRKRGVIGPNESNRMFLEGFGPSDLRTRLDRRLEILFPDQPLDIEVDRTEVFRAALHVLAQKVAWDSEDVPGKRTTRSSAVQHFEDEHMHIINYGEILLERLKQFEQSAVQDNRSNSGRDDIPGNNFEGNEQSPGFARTDQHANRNLESTHLDDSETKTTSTASSNDHLFISTPSSIRQLYDGRYEGIGTAAAAPSNDNSGADAFGPNFEHFLQISSANEPLDPAEHLPIEALSMSADIVFEDLPIVLPLSPVVDRQLGIFASIFIAPVAHRPALHLGSTFASTFSSSFASLLRLPIASTVPSASPWVFASALSPMFDSTLTLAVASTGVLVLHPTFVSTFRPVFGTENAVGDAIVRSSVVNAKVNGAAVIVRIRRDGWPMLPRMDKRSVTQGLRARGARTIIIRSTTSTKPNLIDNVPFDVVAFVLDHFPTVRAVSYADETLLALAFGAENTFGVVFACELVDDAGDDVAVVVTWQARDRSGTIRERCTIERADVERANEIGRPAPKVERSTDIDSTATQSEAEPVTKWQVRDVREAGQPRRPSDRDDNGNRARAEPERSGTTVERDGEVVSDGDVAAALKWQESGRCEAKQARRTGNRVDDEHDDEGCVGAEHQQRGTTGMCDGEVNASGDVVMALTWKERGRCEPVRARRTSGRDNNECKCAEHERPTSKVERRTEINDAGGDKAVVLAW